VFQALLEFAARFSHERIAVAAAFEHAGFDSARSVGRLQRWDLLQKRCQGLGAIAAWRPRRPSRQNGRAGSGEADATRHLPVGHDLEIGLAPLRMNRQSRHEKTLLGFVQSSQGGSEQDSGQGGPNQSESTNGCLFYEKRRITSTDVLRRIRSKVPFVPDTFFFS
jgi:hypothetical protein